MVDDKSRGMSMGTHSGVTILQIRKIPLQKTEGTCLVWATEKDFGGGACNFALMHEA